MDFHSMNRKQLQAQCKKHNIPANLTNLEMLNRLSSLLIHEKEKPVTNKRTCLKSLIETVEENDSRVATRQLKKVRFSPQNEIIEYVELRSGRKEKTKITRARSRARRVSENVNISQSINEVAGNSVRLTRSRAQTSAEAAAAIPLLSPPIEKKQTKRVAKDDGVQSNEEIMVSPVRVTRSRVRRVSDNVNISQSINEVAGNSVRLTRSRAQTSAEAAAAIPLLSPPIEKKRAKRVAKDDGVQSNEEIMVSPVRVTRSRAQTSEVGVIPVLNHQVEKKRARRVAKGVEVVEPSKEIVDIPVRVTRSRVQASEEGIVITVPNPPVEKKRARRETKVADRSVKPTAPVLDLSNNLAFHGTASEETRELPKRSLRNREVEDGKGVDDVSENKTVSVDGGIAQPNKSLRRSRRNGVKIEDSIVLNGNVSKTETVTKGRITRSRTEMAVKSSEGNSETKTETGVEVVHKLEEPLGSQGRNANRRKSVMAVKSGNGVKAQGVPGVVPPLEEPANHLPRKQNKCKPVMRKIDKTGTDKRVVEKRIIPKVNEMVERPNVSLRRSQRQTSTPESTAPTVDNKETPKAVGGKKSAEKSSNPFMMKEGSQDKEHVRRSGRNASRNEVAAITDGTHAISTAGNYRARKRRGDPIVEEQALEIVCSSPVEESPRRFTRSASKNYRKEPTNLSQNVVGKKQKQSKTPMFDVELSAEETPSVEGQPSVDVQFSMSEIAQSKTDLVSGSRSEIIKDNSRKRRSKPRKTPRGIKQGGSGEVRVETSNREDARDQLLVNSEDVSASKFESLQTGDRENENEIHVSNQKGYPVSKEQATEVHCAPTVEESWRRFTRSASKSERNAAVNLPEKVRVRKKQRSQSETPKLELGIPLSGGHSASAIEGQPGEDAHFSMPEVAELATDPDMGSSEVIKVNSSKNRKKSTRSPRPTEEDHSEGVCCETSTAEEAHGLFLMNLEEISASNLEMLQAGVEENETELSISEESSRQTIETECVPSEDSSRRTMRSAAKSERNSAANQPEKFIVEEQQNAVESPYLEVEIPLMVDSSAIKGTPSRDAGFLMTDTTNDPFVASCEVSGDNSLRKNKKSGEISHATKQDALEEIYVETSSLREAKSQVAVKSVETASKSVRLETDERVMEIEASTKSVRLEIDEREKETEISVEETVVIAENVDISLGEVIKKSLQNFIAKVNEDDAGSHSPERTGDFDARNLADQEPVEGLNVADDTVLYETTSISDDYASVKPSDLKTKVEVMKCEQEPSTSKDILQNPAAGECDVAEVPVNAQEEYISAVSEEFSRLSDSIIQDSNSECHLGAFKQREGSTVNDGDGDAFVDDRKDSFVDSANAVTINSGREENDDAEDTQNIAEATINSGREENDDAEDAHNIAEAADPYDSSSRPAMQGANIDASLITSSLPIEESKTVDCGMSVPEVFESSQNALLSSCKEPPEYDDGKRMASTLVKQQNSGHVCPEHSNSKEVEVSVAMNLENALAIKLSNLQSEPEDKPMGIDLSSESPNINEDYISQNLQNEQTDKTTELDSASTSPNSNVDSVSANLQCKPADKSRQLDLASGSSHRNEDSTSPDLQREQADKQMELDLASASPNNNEGSISRDFQNGPADKRMELDLALGSPISNEHSISHNSDYLGTEEHVNKSSNDSIAGTISEPNGLLPVYKSGAIEGLENTMEVADPEKLLPSKHGVLGVGDAADATPENVTNFSRNDQKLVESTQFDEGRQSKECENAYEESKESSIPGFLDRDRSTSNISQGIDDGEDSDDSESDLSPMAVTPPNNVDIEYQGVGICDGGRIEEAVTEMESDYEADFNIERNSAGQLGKAIGLPESSIGETSMPIISKEETDRDANHCMPIAPPESSPTSDDTSSHLDTPLKENDESQHGGEKYNEVETSIDETNMTSTTNREVEYYSTNLQESHKTVPAKESQHKECESLENQQISTSEDINDVHTESKQDYQVQDHLERPVARASPHIDETPNHATEREYISVDKASSNLGDGKSIQGVHVDMIGENYNALVKSVDERNTCEDYFNWHEDSLKQLFASPDNSRTCYKDAKFSHEDMSCLAFSDDKTQEIGRDEDPQHNFDQQWENEEALKDAAFTSLGASYFDGDRALSVDGGGEEMTDVPDDGARSFQEFSEQQFNSNTYVMEEAAFSGSLCCQASTDCRTRDLDSKSEIPGPQNSLFQGDNERDLENSNSRVSRIDGTSEETVSTKETSTIMPDEDQRGKFGPHMKQVYAGASDGLISEVGISKGSGADVPGGYFGSYYNESFDYKVGSFGDIRQDELLKEGAGMSGNEQQTVRSVEHGAEGNKSLVDKMHSKPFFETNSRMLAQSRESDDLSFDEGI